MKIAESCSEEVSKERRTTKRPISESCSEERSEESDESEA
jgi:hypothetical protein